MNINSIVWISILVSAAEINADFSNIQNTESTQDIVEYSTQQETIDLFRN